MLKEMVEKIANPAGWIGYYEGKPATFLFKQEDVPRFLKNTDPVGSVIPLYTHPVKDNFEEGYRAGYKFCAELYEASPVKEHFEDEPQAEELHEIMQSNTYPAKEQDESFDRTASHMAGEYVSYQKELTDELNNLKKENKFFKEILSEMDKQVYNIEFLKQPMQILEDGQIVPVFKELTDEEIIDIALKEVDGWVTKEHLKNFARAILRKANEK